MSKRPRLSDIAQKAGVSQATASLALNAVAHARIAAATRQKVQAIAAEMGYTRRATLPRGGTPVIGLLIDEVVTTPFAPPFIEGARLQAAAQGALVLVCCTGGDPMVEAATIDTLRSTHLKGLLYASIVTRTVKLPDGLDSIPTVLLNCHAARSALPSVVPGDVMGGFHATMALVRAGHRRIAHIPGESWSEAARDRETGWRRAMASADLPMDPSLLAPPAWTATSGRAAALHLLDRHDPPTAIFCFNDRVALGVYEAAAERGLKIPHDLSVVGFDNDDIAATLVPPLTTLILPHDDMARLAVDILLAPATNGPLRMKVECDLVERGSVGPPAI